jgi:hypothetical protein
VRIYSKLSMGTTMCIYLPRHVGNGPDELDDETMLESSSSAAAPSWWSTTRRRSAT